MPRYKWMLFTLVLVAMFVTSALRVAAQEEVERSGLRPDAPEYAIRGPYSVGVQYFTIPAVAEQDRELTASVWYPAVKPDDETGEMVYEQKFEPGDIPAYTTLGFAYPDAQLDDTGAPYPLVVYSHAHWSFGQNVPYLTEHLASHGFVVISVDHEDNWSTDFGPLAYEALARRPQEVTRQIDFAESLSAAGGPLSGMIDTNKIGGAGWSLGAQTMLSVAGARLNLADVPTWCEERMVGAELSPSACADIPGNENALATFAGLDETPVGLWPEQRDERVDAVVSMAPPTIQFGTEGIQSADVPIMFMVGSGETATDPAFEMAKPYESVASERKAKVIFDYAGHTLFGGGCADMPGFAEMGFAMFCVDSVWDVDRAHDLINHFITAFLSAELKGDSEAAAALAPDAVDFPGIDYQSEGYGPEPAALDPALEADIDAYVEEMMDATGLPGFAIGVVKDGQLAYAKGFGVANVETSEPVTPQTVFQLAEVTMAPTTLAMLQLAEEGKIDLDVPITEYLPYFEMAGEGSGDITVRQLLLQTSGTPDSGDTATDWTEMTPELDDEAVERYVRSLVDTELLFAPGEGFEWSDIGFHIVGDVVAKVTSQPYETYMQENLLTPLGMAHSTFLLDEVDPALLASPHIEDDDGNAIVADVLPYSRQFASANNLFSNVEDMARFMQANLNRGELEDATILSASNYDEMWKVHNGTLLGDYQFGSLYPTALFAEQGFGWSVTEILGHPVVHAYGGERGFQSIVMLAPEDNLGVITMGNGVGGGAFYAPDTATDVMGMLLDATVEAPAETGSLEPEQQAAVEAFVQEVMEDRQIPGAAIGIVKGGDLVYAQGFGVAKMGEDEAVVPQSLFQLGSIGKTAVATALFQLSEEGKLDLDAPVTDYLPYFELADERYGDITIRQMLSHTSGMPEEEDLEWDDPAYDDGALERYVRSLSDVALLAAPGEAFAYSDMAFDVLGDVIAKVSDQSFEQYVQEHIFAPLGMKDTTFLIRETNPDLLTTPHVLGESGDVVFNTVFPYNRMHAPSNTLYSNVENMARYATAHLNRGELEGTRILEASSYDEMWAKHAVTGWEEWFGPLVANYGLGWIIGDLEGHPVYNHMGAADGFGGSFQLAPDDSTAVIVMINYMDFSEGVFYASFIADQVMATLLGVEE